ncbi:carboxypeptidase regulatory-like domain-containing protein [Luteimonas sp. 3794]|uniref:carboxypeptidase regulatory-like domain-containing protein n=1 Tax=Luteimonas sp. 3794 TaxID=2817730 RepID=UPI00285A3264|nr:carboxypeptidase regulatory-like domain-containing protein [Luteimonas sp. 3794]MDR6991998.1 hypothetical protein [Luteimonas sp. 3794]
MTPEHGLGAVLVAAALLSIARLAAAHLRAPRGQRPAAWRTLALAVLTAASALLLYRMLLPPMSAGPDTLVVLTADADGLPVPVSQQVIALPEADRVPLGATRMPDLATALRRHPDVRALVVIGAGLQPRDRDAVGGRALVFVPAALPPGLAELQPPAQIAPGARFTVRGRVTGFEEAQVALFDPAGRIVDTGAVDDAGRFQLTGTARGAGATLFEVAIQDVDDSAFSRVTVPVVVDEAAPVRVLLLAGAPNPDVRALRRWSEDAGSTLRWRIAFGGGATAGDAPALDAASLAEQDLVLLEARAWEGLGASARAALLAAVRDGLGMLVHAPESPSNALRGWLRSAGLAVETGRGREWRVDAGPDDLARLRAWSGPGSDDAPFDPQLAGEAPPSLGYLPLTGGLPSAGPGAGDMMRWQALGQGRLGIVTLADSWQLPLAGRADLHSELWSTWAGTLARPGAADVAGFRGEARVGERVALCGLDAGTRVLTPDGQAIAPLPDPAANGCAGLWPRVSGWHRIEDGGALFVRGAEEAPGLRMTALQGATRQLARDGAETRAPAPPAIRPIVWFLAWLLVTAMLWALHRTRRGRGPQAAGV